MQQRLGLRLITGDVGALELELARSIESAQADDPLAPVGILVGGALQRPYLQRRMATLNDGILNVRFLMAGELATLLGERAMIHAGQRPLPPLADRILLGRIAAETPGYFEPVGEAQGFADALHRLVRELRQAGLSAEELETGIAGACEVPEKEQALASIYSRFLEVRSDFYGSDDCLLAADIESPPWVALHVVGTFDPPAALRRLLADLGSRIPVTVHLPETDTEADDATADFRAWLADAGVEHASAPPADSPSSTLAHIRRNLFAEEPAQAPELDGTARLLSAPDPTREVREIARRCLRWARDGVRFHEMAIAYRYPDTYRPAIEAVFAEAGIPVYLHEGSPLVERPLGRQIVALVDLIDGDFERTTVIDFITEARLPEETFERFEYLSATRWDRLSRDAGIVEGHRQWRERLRSLIADLENSDREHRKEHGEDSDSRYRYDLDSARDLLRFIEELQQGISALPDSGSWSEHLEAFGSLLDAYVRDSEPVIEAMKGMHRLEALEQDVPASRFRDLLRSAIGSMRDDKVGPGGRPAAFGRRGINVLDVNSLRLVRFRCVAVLGLVERSFPSPPRQDPLLLDAERRALNEHTCKPLPLRVEGADTEPYGFALAVAAATERLVASFPRKSRGESGAQLPSLFFRSIAEAALGEPVAASEVDSLPADLYSRAEGNRIGATELETALSLPERDRSLIERDRSLGRAVLLRAAPRMEAAFAARHAAFEPRLTAYDGLLPDEVVALRDRYFGDDRQLSPTALQSYARCPHRFLLGNVLGLKPIEEPESVVSISPLDYGSLVHRILERFLKEDPAPGEERIHGSSEERRLLRIAEECGEKVEAEGRTGYAMTWRARQEEIREDLVRWLDNERQDPAVTELPEGDYETRFGYARSSEEEGRLSRDEQLEITVPGLENPVRIGGRVDRLAWNPERTRFRVIDYKTGKSSYAPKDGSLVGGEALQLPIYLRAGEAILDIPLVEGHSASAEYHYATRTGRFKRSTFTSDDLRERAADLDKVFATIVGGIREGVFHRQPEKERYCSWCDFDGICPTARFHQIERKSEDEAMRRHDEMREIE